MSVKSTKRNRGIRINSAEIMKLPSYVKVDFNFDDIYQNLINHLKFYFETSLSGYSEFGCKYKSDLSFTLDFDKLVSVLGFTIASDIVRGYVLAKEDIYVCRWFNFFNITVYYAD